MKRIILAAVALLTATGMACAQTKAETKLYDKTLKKPSVKAYDKFLTKYPESVYSLEILTLRDTELLEGVDKEDAYAVAAFAEQHPDSPVMPVVTEILERHNTSTIGREEARAIAAEARPGVSDAVGYKFMGDEYVIALGVEDSQLVAYRVRKGDDAVLTVEEMKRFERYSLDSMLSETRFEGSLELVKMNNRNLLHFSSLNFAENSKNLEFVTSLYDIENDAQTNAMFYGRNMGKSLDEYRIEGQCPEALAGGIMLPENAFLINSLNSNPALEQISKANALTDDSIAWWLSKNPTAETTATRLTFGALDEESSLVEGFRKCSSRDKDSSSNFTAALFNIRDYTVIVAYSKTNKNYILLWCEPVCKNKNRDKLLNTIYFEDANTLDLFYYKGKTTFKIRVNAATRAVRR